MPGKFSRLLLLLPFAVVTAIAQDAVEEQAQTDTARPAGADSQVAAEVPSETDSLEPAVRTSTLAPDVRRRAVASGVMDEIELARTEITGNQELPKVLYIVPWQKSDPGDLTGKPVNTLLDDVLAPIDRTEFIRQVEYYGDLYGNDED